MKARNAFAAWLAFTAAAFAAPVAANEFDHVWSCELKAGRTLDEARAAASAWLAAARSMEHGERLQVFIRYPIIVGDSGDRFDFVDDLGAEMPMRVIGMLVGIPDELQRDVRKVAGRRLRNNPGEPLSVSKENYFNGNMFREYVDWRQDHPADDLVTELLNVEFTDAEGIEHHVSRETLAAFVRHLRKGLA